MKGTSKLMMNQDTILVAVQDYLDKNFTPKIRLDGFVPKSEGTTGYNATWSYEATISEVTPATNATAKAV